MAQAGTHLYLEHLPAEVTGGRGVVLSRLLFTIPGGCLVLCKTPQGVNYLEKKWGVQSGGSTHAGGEPPTKMYSLRYVRSDCRPYFVRTCETIMKYLFKSFIMALSRANH